MTKKSASKARGPGCLGWAARAAIIAICLIGFFAAFLLQEGDSLPANPLNPPTSTPVASRGRTAMSAGLIRAYFSTSYLVYPDKRSTRPDSPMLSDLLDDIDKAEQHIDMAGFDIDILELADALIDAKKRGVQVRVVEDGENLSDPGAADVAGRLQDAGIAVTFDEREAFMHHKFVVIDKRIVWAGSWNLTYNDTFRNNNNMLRLRSQLAAESYSYEFDQLFAHIFGPAKSSLAPHPRIVLDETPVDLYFSPQDGAASQIISAIEGARRNIRFMAFSFTSDDITDALLKQADSGVKIQGVMERQNAEGAGADFTLMQKQGLDVLEDGSCYLLHHKVMIIDDRIVITGSYNFTNSAERDNDENLLIINDREVAQRYNDEFTRIYKLAQQPTRCR